jgi:5-formyltetrahydrofolate cyclo-ligase
MTKKELRIKYKSFRKELSAEVISEKSLAIANQLLPLPIWDKNYFHLFLPIKEHNEVDTEYILHLLSGKDKNIVISRSDFETYKMHHVLLTDTTKLVVNEYGIAEPEDGTEVDVSKIDVVFIPLLAFDKKGHRVGYGKGFYDKFLSECNDGSLKIGLSFFEPEEAIDDVFENDVALDYCVTPTGVHRF